MYSPWNIVSFHGVFQLKTVYAQGRRHTVPVLLPVALMKIVVALKSAAVMAVVPGVWNQVRMQICLCPLFIHTIFFS